MPKLSLAITLTTATSALSLLLSSCGNQAGGTIEVYETAGYQPNFGPFDSNGNYVDKWADSPPRRKYIPRGSKKSKSSPPPRPQQYAVATAPPVAPVKVTPKPKPPSRSVAVKPKSKPPITHTVKRGDTLYGLSRKYGTTVGSIQRANNLRGTTIGIGQRLIIPRR